MNYVPRAKGFPALQGLKTPAPGDILFLMNNIGIIEGFFGPQWNHESRLSYADFLSRFGGDFFIYAPKQDANLRKNWRAAWSEAYVNFLTVMARRFHAKGIKFGVGFSPFGLGTNFSEEDKAHLRARVKVMQEIGIDVLGLFFDDMPITENLARNQIECLDLIQEEFKNKIIFCPSFYTPDPILDKVFGQRPERYLEDIAEGVSQNVSLAWTGPKVISPVIDKQHILETKALLKRKPFIWENLFANDGPRNCKFLKLKPFSGRDSDMFQEVEAFGFNMMNQPELSKIVYLASMKVLKGGEAVASYQNAIREICTPAFSDFLIHNSEAFLTKGLDNFSQEEKDHLLSEVKGFPDPAAREVQEWLEGKFIVGSECLTD